MSAGLATDRFLETLRKSSLVEEPALQAWLTEQTEKGTLPDSSNDLAAALLRDGLISRFQAQHLLAGKSRGYIVSDKYRILELLGQGAAGRVFLCEHVLMRRLFAIKVLTEQASRRKETMERFYREARASGLLDHPNMVRCIDIDQRGSMHFLVMEYVDGVNLYDYVQKNGPLPVDQAANYIAQAASGLQYAFEAGLIHRDIKPGNLLVNRAGVVKILDMGLARFYHDANGSITRETDREELLGTIDYIAPEQALDSHDVDIRADIYSLGASFYYLLTGRGPFLGSTAEKLMRHQVAKPHPIRDSRPDVPAEVEQIIFKMLAKDPAERYQIPAEVEDALSSWLEPLLPPNEAEMPSHCALVERLVKQSASAQGTLSNIGGMTLRPQGGSSQVNMPSVVAAVARVTAQTASQPVPPPTVSDPTPFPLVPTPTPVLTAVPTRPRFSWAREMLLGGLLLSACMLLGLFFGGAFSNRANKAANAPTSAPAPAPSAPADR